jgi:hypothetical protein
MLSGRWKSMAMLVRYGKKINAKRSGIADLTTQLGWNSNKKPDDNLVKKLDSSELSLVDAQDESD